MPALKFAKITDTMDAGIRGVHYYEIRREADRDWSVRYGINEHPAGLTPATTPIGRAPSKRQARGLAEDHHAGIVE